MSVHQERECTCIDPLNPREKLHRCGTEECLRTKEAVDRYIKENRK